MIALLLALAVASTDHTLTADFDALQGAWLGENGYTLVVRANEVTFTSADGYSGHTATLTLYPRLRLWRETDELGTLERRYALDGNRLVIGEVEFRRRRLGTPTPD